MKTTNMTPGEELRDRRIKAGLTQTMLGQFTGYTQASISQMERGQIAVQPRVAEEVGMVVTPRREPPTTHRASGARKVQVVMSPEAAAVWDSWVVEARKGLLSASARVSGMIEAAAAGEVQGWSDTYTADLTDLIKRLRTEWPCTHYGVPRYHTCQLCGGHIDIDSDAVEKTWRHEHALETVLRALEEALAELSHRGKGVEE